MRAKCLIFSLLVFLAGCQSMMLRYYDIEDCNRLEVRATGLYNQHPFEGGGTSISIPAAENLVPIEGESNCLFSISRTRIKRVTEMIVIIENVGNHN